MKTKNESLPTKQTSPTTSTERRSHRRQSIPQASIPQPKVRTRKHLTIIKAVAWAVAIQALTTSARSAVNLKDAAFLTTAKDITLHSTEGPPLAFKRYYSSRSHYLGWFGFGWCTDFEKKIEMLEDQKLRLHDCKMSRPEDLSPADYKKMPDRIIVTKNATLEQPSKSITEFDLKGRMIKITSQDLNASIHYLKNIAQITVLDPNEEQARTKVASHQLGIKRNPSNEVANSTPKKSLKIIFDPATQMVKSLSSDNQKIEYDYDGDNLVAVKEKTLALNYHYNSYQNIERIDYQDKTFETIAYDSDQDRVRIFRDRKGCIEKFTFERIEKNEKPERETSFLPRSTALVAGLSTVERRCQGRLVAHALFKVNVDAKTAQLEKPKIERLPSNAGEQVQTHDQGELQ